ncbi:MAG: hypothetical protein U1E23_06710 [Reyranellaceae bacterium]
MNVLFAPACSDLERRRALYDGDLLILPPSPGTLDLAAFARSLIEEAFAPWSPPHAHEHLPVQEAVDVLVKLKPHFIHHPRTKGLLQRVLLEHGCDPDTTYQDVPRLRVAYPKDYLTTGIAYAHHPHRDTWYSAPSCQLNWWMPLWDFEARQGMAFHPSYWNRAIDNDSAGFDYYRWNAEGRRNAGQHVGKDTRRQPHALETLALDDALRFVVPTGGIILFSADQLHSTVPNETALARWSIDFRTVDLDDVAARRGAPARDAACTGTSLRDFRRVRDLAAMPEDVVAALDTGTPEQGAAVYRPQPAGDQTIAAPL